MSDERPRRRSRITDELRGETRTRARSSSRTTTAPRTTRQVPEWRQRLYRTPGIGTIAYIVWPPRTGKPSPIRRSISSALAIIAILGIGMAAYPWAGDKYPFFYRTPVEKLIEWSNFLSDLQTNKIQDRLEKEFLACGGEYCRGEGDPLTRIQIPKIGVNTIVVEGTTPSALKAGAGHYRSTPLPGQAGNVAIAGHRTTYGRPFNRIDGLKPGDKVILTTPIGRFTYVVMKPPKAYKSTYPAAFITHPFDWSVTAKTKGSYVTLTSCHPKGSARQRIIVRAKLIDTDRSITHKAA